MFGFQFIKGLLDFGNAPIIGVDLSSGSIKLLHLALLDSGWRVENYAYSSLPEGVYDAGVIKNHSLFSEMMQVLFQELKLDTRKVAVSLPDSFVINKVIQVSEELNEMEMEELITIESDSYFPYPIEEVNFDFQILGASEKAPTLMDVLLVATRKDNVRNLQDAFAEARLELSVLDVQSYAVERVLPLVWHETFEEGENQGITLIVDIGFQHTRLYAFSEDNVVFVREEEFGGRQLLDMIAAQYDVNIDVARNHLLSQRLSADFQEQVCMPFFNLLTTQINRLIDFFFSVSHFGEAHRLYLAGGVANMSNITSFIEEKVKIPTFLINPFEKMTFAPHVDRQHLISSGSAWIETCGLAMRNGFK